MWKYHFSPIPLWIKDLSFDILGMSNKHSHIFADLLDHDLFCASDYSGGSKDRKFHTFTFLVATAESTEKWNKERKAIRVNYLHNRRMSYKDLGDNIRKKALPEFLEAANQLHGVIFTFAVSKDTMQNFCRRNEIENILGRGLHRANWKDKSFRKMVIVGSLQTFLIGGIIGNENNIIWCTDDDDFTATNSHLMDFGSWMHMLRKRNMPYHKGFAAFHTASEITPDDKELFFEDLCSIPDLVAGAWSEAWMHAFKNDFPAPGMPFLMDYSNSSEKASTIIKWTCKKHFDGLKKIHCIIGKPKSMNGNFSVLSIPSFDLPS